MGDINHKVKHSESISITPVVFGIRKSIAENLRFVGTRVSVNDIIEAINEKKFSFAMTSATQSNSGASAYIGFLSAIAGSPDVLTESHLQNPELKTKIMELLGGVNRSSGSSEWLKTMFLDSNYDDMVNYESLILTTNIELEKKGEEPLYLVYPYYSLSISDAPLAYVDNGDKKKEDTFLKL